MTDNRLFYGDNLPILRERIPDNSVDLIYLDPPFNSNRDYNVLFKDESGRESDAQIRAFGDTWHWGPTAQAVYEELITGPDRVASVMEAMHTLIGPNQMMAYLVMMTIRLVELRRVLKPTGSLYLHCDPTASHYLKVVLDTIFGPENYRNEIIWKRTFAHGNVGRNYGKITDTIYWYTKSNKHHWSQQHTPLTSEEIELKYPHADADGRRWQSVTLRNPGPRPNLHYPYTASNGITYQPHPNGWSCNMERMQKYDRENRLHFPSSPEGALRLKMYADKSPGDKLQNLWDDIPPIGSQAKERLGYPTQKPVALLERIVQASSNPGDLVLDPFAGCGTAIAAAQKLGRQWIGIDITHLSVGLLKYRLRDTFDLDWRTDYRVIGEPEDVPGARQLASDDRYQFQFWAASLVEAQPLGGEPKKGKDRGVDGVIRFIDGAGQKQTAQRVLVQVKSGKVSSRDIRDLVGTVDRENAALGVFITLEEPTRDMLTEALSAGTYESPLFGRSYRKIQIFTVQELLSGKSIDMPPQHGTFKQAERDKGEQPTTRDMFGGM